MARRRNSRHSLRSLWSNSRRQVSPRSVLRTRAMKPASSGAPSLLALHSLPTRAFAATAVLCLGEKIEVTDERAGARVLVDHFNLFPPQAQVVLRGGWRDALGAISGATKKIGFGGGTRSVLRGLTHRHCLTTTNEVSGGSLPMHPRSRSSSWSRPLGRPPRHEPPAHRATRRAAHSSSSSELLLHRPRHPRHVVLDKERVDERNRKRTEQRPGHQRPPVVDVPLHQLRDHPHRHRLHLR
jgi:hypothetical protein